LLQIAHMKTNQNRKFHFLTFLWILVHHSKVICSAQIFLFVPSWLLISNLINQFEYPIHKSEQRSNCRPITHIGHKCSSNCPTVWYLQNTSVSETQFQNYITSVQSRLTSTNGILIVLANDVTKDKEKNEEHDTDIPCI
jgi:hypothetical protein